MFIFDLYVLELPSLKSFFRLKPMDMVYVIFLVTLVLCSLIDHIQCEDSCHSLYEDFSQHLASKTPYRYIANHDTKPVDFEGKCALSFFNHFLYQCS